MESQDVARERPTSPISPIPAYKMDLLVSKMQNRVKSLKSTHLQQLELKKKADFLRAHMDMYKHEEILRQRQVKELDDCMVGLKECSERLISGYNSLKNVVDAADRIKYRKEYKEAVKILEEYKQYLPDPSKESIAIPDKGEGQKEIPVSELKQVFEMSRNQSSLPYNGVQTNVINTAPTNTIEGAPSSSVSPNISTYATTIPSSHSIAPAPSKTVEFSDASGTSVTTCRNNSMLAYTPGTDETERLINIHMMLKESNDLAVIAGLVKPHSENANLSITLEESVQHQLEENRDTLEEQLSEESVREIRDWNIDDQ